MVVIISQIGSPLKSKWNEVEIVVEKRDSKTAVVGIPLPTSTNAQTDRKAIPHAP